MANDFKPGVNWNPTEALQRAHNIAAVIYNSLGVPFVVTSGRDGQHMSGSLHYSGNAMDLRRHDLDAKGVTGQAVNMLRSQLGGDYDVVLESDHIHVEYDPKEGGAAPRTAINWIAVIGIVAFALLLLKR
jgi:hypothetical protein